MGVKPSTTISNVPVPAFSIDVLSIGHGRRGGEGFPVPLTKISTEYNGIAFL